jgi:DNA modification methylase
MLIIFVFFSVISMILVGCFAVAVLNVVIRRESAYLIEERIKVVVDGRKELLDSVKSGVQACPESRSNSLQPVSYAFEERGQMSLLSEDAHEYSARDLSSFINNRELPRHRWFEFKEGFSAELVRVAIAESKSKKPRVLDPFSGSGTTVVEAARNGCRATGIEVNPFLLDVASAKCHHSIPDTLAVRNWLSDLSKGQSPELRSPLEGQSTFTESVNQEKWLFNTSVLRGFTAQAAAVNHLSASWKTAMKVTALSALMDCSNVRRDGKCVRYKKGWREAGLTSSDFRSSFVKVAAQVVDDLEHDELTAGLTTLISGDSKAELRKITSKSHDLLVTSPPYLNSFDYSDVYRPELFAGEYVGTNEDLREIRLRTLRSHVQVQRLFASSAASPMLEPILAELRKKELWNKRIPGMVASYFWDMKTVLRESYRVVRPGGAAWLVVSTSAYGGVHIPVDLILADIGEQCGWSLRGVYVLRRLRSAGQHWAHVDEKRKLPLRESLIVLDRPKD